MNSGLPSLLDAIFGKQDLDMVSLEEIYEVIREFPSFNAGHFLLSKKLKLQVDPGYELESMRTALYFNNPFWLQSLLDDGNHFQPAASHSPVKEAGDEDQFNFEIKPEDTPDITQEESNYTFESYTPVEKSVIEKDELDEETEEILDEKLNSDPERSEETVQSALDSDPVRSEETFQYAEPGSQTVTSFDELMAKYNLKPLDMVDETVESPEAVLPVIQDVRSEPEVVNPATQDVHSEPEAVLPLTQDVQSETEAVIPAKENVQSESPVAQEFKLPAAEHNPDKGAVRDNNQFERLEEIVNEYGIFEEIVAKKTDHDLDMDAFDEPLDQIPFVSDKIVEEAIPAGNSESTIHTEGTEYFGVDEDVNNTAHTAASKPMELEDATVNTIDITNAENTEIIENAIITENQESEDAPHQTDEHDYDAFDRPLEEPVQAEAPVNENSNELIDYDPDNTGEPVEYSNDSESGANGQMQELSERFEEHQKLQSSFNAKNADSIVFTPYHMVDYFASQGIKLILEDNPPDQFGKQLKSFTDWLKVMKKLPPQPSSEKEDEKQNEQIRHFAAHSIEERDILTESMAEVLAKQGMYENAIALFQKLSLIYPPKSAYFASRIEQLKASLP